MKNLMTIGILIFFQSFTAFIADYIFTKQNLPWKTRSKIYIVAMIICAIFFCIMVIIS